jgi:hypothetical protein
MEARTKHMLRTRIMCSRVKMTVILWMRMSAAKVSELMPSLLDVYRQVGWVGYPAYSLGDLGGVSTLW